MTGAAKRTSRRTRIAFALVGATIFGVFRGSVGRLLRTIDQRAGVFAPRGARLYSTIAPPILRPLYRRAAEDAASLSSRGGSAGTRKVLEIGSGPGELALETARRIPAAEYVGVDLAQAMIDRAVAVTNAVHLDARVRFLRSDPAAVLAEVGRVLEPGGSALIYDLRPFTYSRGELGRFIVGSPFEGSRLEREYLRVGALPFAPFVRIRLDRPTGS